MSYMIEKGEKLSCYAPGDGALSFCWDYDGKATGREVKREEIERFLSLERNSHLRDYEIHKVNSQWRLVAPVMRVTPDSLILLNKKLVVKYSGGGDFNTVFTAEDDGHIVKNESMTSALKFFLRHEDQLKEKLNGS